MEKPEDYGGENSQNKSCVYCSNEDGSLKPRDIVREGMIEFWMAREKLDRASAEKATDDHMLKMPAWK